MLTWVRWWSMDFGGQEEWVKLCTAVCTYLHICPLHSSYKVKCSISGISLTLHLSHSSVWSRVEMSGANTRLWHYLPDKKVKSKCQKENDKKIDRLGFHFVFVFRLQALLFWDKKGCIVLCILVSDCKYSISQHKSDKVTLRWNSKPILVYAKTASRSIMCSMIHP